MDFDLGPFLSAAVGAGAALGGVLITQRSVRKNAHEDRIWEQRTAAYGALDEYVGNKVRATRHTSDKNWAILDTPLDKESERQLFLFGSDAVVKAYRELRKQLVDVFTAVGSFQQAPRLALRAQGIELQNLITSETRGVAT